jgi:hypothetical protein
VRRTLGLRRIGAHIDQDNFVMFNPNQRSLAACMQELRDFQKAQGLDTRRIVTSQDEVVRKHAYETLAVHNVPEGFTKTRLPVFFEGATTLYISSAAPGATVEPHSHDEGDGIRVMLTGSIRFGERELRAGDWMFGPAGQKYEFTVGPTGASMFYCYACCCA